MTGRALLALIHAWPPRHALLSHLPSTKTRHLALPAMVAEMGGGEWGGGRTQVQTRILGHLVHPFPESL